MSAINRSEYQQETLNVSKAETAANTFTYSNVEVPNAAGAKRVFMTYCEIQTTMPDKVAATETCTHAAIFQGKLVPTTTELSSDGCLTNVHHTRYCSAGPTPVILHTTGPEAAPITPPGVEIYRHRDGKFYVTLAIKGENNAAAATVYAHMRFAVYK